LGESVKTPGALGVRPLELARALTDHGDRAPDALTPADVQARTELECALELAHHSGARGIVAGARAELTAAGAKPRRDALTAGELRVARLDAEGSTHRAIAPALFSITRTAKTNLSRVHRKLVEITRRGQLANALTGQLDDSHKHPLIAAAVS
jgi:DNA-binding NarL/FixJ family response regulator